MLFRSTQSATTQSFFLDGAIVTTFGLRTDKNRSRDSNGAVVDANTGLLDYSPLRVWGPWLEKSGRTVWLDDEMQVLKNPATYEQHPDQAWERLRGRARKPRDLAVLMEIAAWREREAQTRDVPRSRVLKDDVLCDIVLAAPRTGDALAQLRSFPRGMERSKAGAEILAAKIGRAHV